MSMDCYSEDTEVSYVQKIKFLCHKTVSRRPVLHGHKSHLCTW